MPDLACISTGAGHFDWLENIRGQLNPPEFDPPPFSRRLTSPFWEHLERLVLPALPGFRAGPGLHLHSRPGADGATERSVCAGRIDMAIIGNDWEPKESYQHCLLTDSRFVHAV